tara:strand:- start:106 stop:828 length:723 start_codon:yes stop_codon:yes gene_type:complete
MSKSLKLFLGITYLIILIAFLLVIFSYIEISRLNEFAYYKELQVNLEKIIGTNYYLNLSIFFVFCIIWVTLLGFGSPLVLVSGILFGKWIGTLISTLAISIGALFLYSIANFFFKELIFEKLNKKFSKFIYLFNKNEFNYFLIFRLCGGLGIPFAIQNILPVIFDIKKINYFFATLIGFVPMFFIWNSIGAGLNEYIKKAHEFNLISFIFTKEIYMPVLLFFFIILVSTIIKKKIFNSKD